MRIQNALHFTENHRFYVYRAFSLSPLDYRMLGSVYQPMVGAFAMSLYTYLYQQLAADRVGYSALELQLKLFLALDLDPGEKGRRYLIEQCTKLEAIGLLHTSRKYVGSSDESVYEYHLQAPLSPDEFFQTQHLVLLLRDKVGNFSVLSLKESFVTPEPEEIAGTGASEPLTVPFYEWFRLNTVAVDHELEQALAELATTKQEPVQETVPEGFTFAQIIMRFPHGSVNRPFVERLRDEPGRLSTINYIAKKYDLTLQELCRLLDEDGAFGEAGEPRKDALEHVASHMLLQTRKRAEDRDFYVGRHEQEAEKGDGAERGGADKPVDEAYLLEVPSMFQAEMDQAAYNRMLRNEPYTVLLKRFFPKGSVPRRILDTFARIDLTYRLSEEVINVLIHHIHTNKLSWAGSFVDTVAGDMLGRQVQSYEEAVGYIREKTRGKSSSTAKAGGARGASSSRREGPRKPSIPLAAAPTEQKKLSEEERQRIYALAKKLDQGRNEKK